jgi:peptidoglycan/LPS O-acetylase OafA/YrhL
LKTHKGFIPHIAGLRGFAVLLVIFQHFGVRGFDAGFIGVDIFFVISGFLITGILIDEYLNTRDRKTRAGSISLKGFYLRRARRILPAALVVTLSIAVFSWFTNNTSRFNVVANDAIWSTLFSANIHFALQSTDYFQIGAAPSPFQHFWSLAVEEQFYFIWPALIMLALALRGLKIRGKRVTWQRRFFAIFLGTTVISLSLMIWTFSSQPSLSYFLTSSRAWELSVGALAAMFVRSKKLPNKFLESKLLAYSPLPLLLLSLVFIRSDNFGYTLPLAVIAALILVSKPSNSTDLDVKLLSSRVPRFVGNISYSLYLWHWPILTFGTELGYADSLLGKVGLATLAFGLSTLSYYFVELKFQKISIPKFSRDNSKKLSKMTWIITSSALVLGVVAIPSAALQPEVQVFVTGLLAKPQTNAALNPATKPSPTTRPTKSPTVGDWFTLRQAEIAASNKDIGDRGSLTADQISEINRVSSGGTWAQKTDFTCTWGDCTLGQPSAPLKMLLLGDSHALMYHTTFTTMRHNGIQLFVKSFTTVECPNVLDIASVPFRSDLDSKFIDRCDKIHPAAIEYLRREGPVFDYIVLSDLSPSGSNYIRDAASYIKSLKAFGKKIVVMGQAPASKDLSSCLNRDYSNYALCSGRKPSSIQDYRTAQRTGVSFGDLGALFCIANFCPILVGEAPTATRGHLTDVSAASIAPYFLDFLKDAKVPAK